MEWKREVQEIEQLLGLPPISKIESPLNSIFGQGIEPFPVLLKQEFLDMNTDPNDLMSQNCQYLNAFDDFQNYSPTNQSPQLTPTSSPCDSPLSQCPPPSFKDFDNTEEIKTPHKSRTDIHNSPASEENIGCRKQDVSAGEGR